MSDIIQRLGFDAGTAISTITSLKTALDGLNKSLSGAAGGVKKFNGAGGLSKSYSGATNQINKCNNALQRMRQNANRGQGALIQPVSSAAAQSITATGNAVEKASNKTKEFTISWQTLARVVSTRLTLGAFNMFVSALRDGTKAAIDFGIRLAEIGTIAGKGTNLGGIRKELISISKETGAGLSDVAEGYYQTLSNQVGNATESLQVFRAAGKLAVATNSSLENSVNLTTAALNGWNKDASQAGAVTGKLFKTIELGRLRVGDLANTLGAVGPIASQMGVSLEETLASLANMTVKGTRATKSITQLRAIMTQMLKPTDALKTLMQDEWGVDNAEQAIKMFGGMNNMLAELDKLSGGASDSMAEFFSNVRALSGVFAQTGDMNKTLGTIKEIDAAGEELLDWAAQLVLDTPAKRAELAFNDLKISLQETGTALIPFVTNGAKAIGLMADNMKFLAAATATFAAVAVVSKIMTMVSALNVLQKAALVTRASMVALSAVGLGAAFLAGYAIGEGINWLLNANERMVEHVRLLKEVADANAATTNKSISKALEEQVKGWDKLEGKAIKYFAALQKGYRATEKLVKEAADASQEFGKARFDSLIKNQQALVDGLSKAEAKAAQVSKAAHKDIVNQKTTLDQKRFDWQVGKLNDISKAEAQGRRASELINKGTRLARGAKSPEQLERAKELIELGQQQAEQAESSASSIQHEGTQVRSVTSARQKQVQAMNALIGVSKREQALSRKAASTANANLKAQEKRLEDMKRLTANILKGSTVFDKKGARKSTKEIASDGVKAQKSWGELLDMFGREDQLKNLQLSDLLGLGKLGQQLNAEGSKLPDVKVKLDSDYAGFINQLQAAADSIPVEIKVFLKLQGEAVLDTDTPADISKKFARAGESVETLKRKLVDSKKAYVTLEKSVESLEAPREYELSEGAPGKMRNYVTELAKVKAELKAIKELDFDPGSGAAAQVDALHLRVSKLLALQKEIGPKKGGNELGWNFTSQAAEVEKLAFALALMNEDIQKAKKADLGGQETGEIQRNAQRFSEILNKFTGDKKIEFKVDQAGLEEATTKTTAIKTTAETMQATAFVNSMTQAQIIMNQIATTAASMPSPSGDGGTVQTSAHGGLIKYLSGGGFAPKGTDTVPAMLTPGEFVVNAKSSKQFYSQLVAMNAGIKPTYRAEGGAVTNNNIGDINVSVNGGPSTNQSARDIATALRREMRRNTLSLK